MYFTVIPTAVESREARKQAGAAMKKAADVSSEVMRLQNRLDRLHLITQALWELLREKLALTDEQLTRLIEEIDSRDGVKNAKVAIKPVTCPDCKRPASVRTDMCIYCGKQVERKSPF